MNATPSLVTPAENDSTLSHGARTLASLLIFIHLFALAVALTAFSVSSELERNLGNVMAHYLQPLLMNLSYRFHLTYGEEADAEHFIEAELQLPGGERKTVVLPPAGIGSGLRYRHYEQMARLATSGAEEGESGPWLLKLIATRLAAEEGAVGGTIRARRHLPRPMAALNSESEAERDPHDRRYYRTVYSATMIVLPDGRVELAKQEPLGDVAPVPE